MDITILSIVFISYFLLVGYVGYIAWKRTKSSEDYLIAGRKTHSYIMALSYGATFISTSAIVGFGGVAGEFGLGILWLSVLTILVGVFIAFVFFGKRTRKMAKNLKSLSFPEFLARRFKSPFIQYFSGLLIFLAMPLYASVVLIGAGRFMETALSIDFSLAMLILSVVVLLYVFFGGIRGVMYTDALQGTIMFLAMIFLLVFTYLLFGGVEQAHTALTNLAPHFPASSVALGGTGWTSFPSLGSPIWWNLISTIIVGVGIGVLVQPQLIVRFMTVNSDKELNRGVLMGGIFIAVMTTTAFIVGALSNAYFFQTLNQVSIDVVSGNIDKIIPAFISSALPEWFTYVFLLTLLAASMSTLSSQYHTQGTALGNDIFKPFRYIYNNFKANKDINANTNADDGINNDKNNKISNININNMDNNKNNDNNSKKEAKIMDMFTTKSEDFKLGVLPTRLGILIAVIIAFILSLILPGSIIAQGTAIFYGICAAAFLAVYVAALYWKRATRQGAIAGIVSGTVASLFWLVFVFKKTAIGLGICEALTGKAMLIATMPWPAIDPIIIGVPVSIIFTVIVSLLTKAEDKDFVEECFKKV
ncbi:MAG: sodium:solute symporter family protein [Methanobacteriaceae archaeon]